METSQIQAKLEHIDGEVQETKEVVKQILGRLNLIVVVIAMGTGMGMAMMFHG